MNFNHFYRSTWGIAITASLTLHSVGAAYFFVYHRWNDVTPQTISVELVSEPLPFGNISIPLQTGSLHSLHTLDPDLSDRFEPIEAAPTIQSPSPITQKNKVVKPARAHQINKRSIQTLRQPSNQNLSEPQQALSNSEGSGNNTGNYTLSQTTTTRGAQAVLLSNGEIPYPTMARRQGIVGTVELSIQVRADGTPIKIEVLRSSGSELLDSAALKGASGWKFQPALLNGEPVNTNVIIPVRFTLKQ